MLLSVPLCHAIRTLQFIDVIQLWLINSLLGGTPYLAVDQTEVREVRFRRVKRVLPTQNVVVTNAWCARGVVNI